MPTSYWQTREGRVEQAIRVGLRNAGVKGPLPDLVGPIKAEILELDRDPESTLGTEALGRRLLREVRLPGPRAAALASHRAKRHPPPPVEDLWPLDRTSDR